MIWNFDPIAFSVWGLEIRWYGLVYVFGFFSALFWGRKLAEKLGLNISNTDFESLIFGLFFTGIIGGRLGEFLFYSPAVFWTDPLEVLKIWHGGMSIHGGILAASAFGAWWCRKHKVSFWRLADCLMLPLAITLGLGRIANFINGELVGVPTNQAWGIVFPHVDELLRHPSQLYEAGKNFLLAGILGYLFHEGYTRNQGFLFGVFIVGYGVLRFGIEFFREPDGMWWVFSTGQWLCVGMVFLGSWLIRNTYVR